jgi:precorrin-6B methylase 2
MVLSQGFRASQILLTANYLDLFTKISGQSLTAQEIAGLLNTDIRATRIVLDSLAALEILEKEGDRFCNSQLAEEQLVKGREDYQGDILKHNYGLWFRWSHLLDVLRTGEPTKTRGARRSPDEQRNFILGMSNLARRQVKDLVSALDLSGARMLLDVGGGPGTYSIGFCQHFPQLQSVVFDLPETIAIAEEQIRLYNMQDRVRTQIGDYLEDEFGAGFDAVFVSSIIHSLGPEDNRMIFRKSYQALDSGGKIIVKDHVMDESRTAPLDGALFAVNMLIGTSEGDCYTYGEITDWLKEAGFRDFSKTAANERTMLVIGKKR